MMQGAYLPDKLYSIAQGNYRIMKGFCDILNAEGYWDSAYAVLMKSAGEMLDLYLQSVLLVLTENNGQCTQVERFFMENLPDSNMLGISKEEEVSAEAHEAAHKVYQSPPILLQVLGLRDLEKETGTAGLFFDALLNIMLAMVYIGKSETVKASRFIKEFYEKVAAFLTNSGNSGACVDKKYIFLKLCNGNLAETEENLKASGEDFGYYKRHFLYYVKCAGAGRADIKEEQKKISYEPEKGDVSADAPEGIGEQKDSHAAEADALEGTADRKDDAELEKLLNELNSLIGLDGVKEEIHSLINLIKVKKMREEHSLPSMDMSFHMVFSGSPGTGKTTVARLVALIYKELGLLSSGQLIETDRAGLVAGYVGQTALKVKEAVEKAIGGILFIDEAYALSPADATNDFGSEAIDTLVKMMEDNRDNLVVIVAGYTEEMRRFLKSNTGLVSRFNKFIMFNDYSTEEMIDILGSMASKAGFLVHEEAAAAVRDKLLSMSDEERAAFGNARGIRNMFERFVMNQANRVVKIESPTVDELSMLLREDIV